MVESGDTPDVTGGTPVVVVGSYLNRLKKWQPIDENPGDSSTSPTTRTEALDRIRTLLGSGQFNLFSELPEDAEGRPECNARPDMDSSMQFDG